MPTSLRHLASFFYPQCVVAMSICFSASTCLVKVGIREWNKEKKGATETLQVC